ncbi:MAG: PspC domain-containing protein [Bifidobacterium sp.]|uniref:ATP-binding protein n=1 Tax=Bifidobacterium sp. TaxID=41200 RepID=UPI003F056634
MTQTTNAPRRTNIPPADTRPYQAPAPLAPAKLPLLRPKYGRMLCGVCRGISMHLGIPVWLVRLAFICSSFVFGAGIIAYIFLWLTVPVGDPVREARRMSPVSQSPLSRGNAPYPMPGASAAAMPQPVTVVPGHVPGQAGNPSRTQVPTPAPDVSVPATNRSGAPNTAAPDTARPDAAAPPSASYASADERATPAAESMENGESLLDAIRRAPKPAIIALSGVIMLIISGVMLYTGETAMILPAIMTVSGVLIAWLRFNDAQRQWPTAILGLALLVGAFCITVLLEPGTPQMHGKTILAAVALLVATALAVIPWIMSLTRSLSTERALKEREEERADMTAHLHDGVLQTLALIQLHSSEPQTVLALARQQERELRNWLYQERTAPDKSVSAGIKDIAAEVEDESGKAIEVVTVGDAQPCTQTDALLNATRQALINAVTHGGEPISVYCEAGATTVDVYVRDHGEGFDVNAIPEGRLGIRESIIGRIKRRGGTVQIVSRPHWGTEVRMHMPIGDTASPTGARTHIMDSASNDQHRASGIEEQ